MGGHCSRRGRTRIYPARMSDRYRTLSGTGQAVLREKASRFIAIAFPIDDQDDFKQRLDAIAREHHSSRHVCYAWVLGEAGDHQRANDAGEPAGTAGRPILNRILGLQLTYTAVVVVRYFGGTLLGKSGLIKAYGDAAQLALNEAPITERQIRGTIAIVCTHAQFETLKRELKALQGEVLKSEFSSMVNAIVAVPKSKVQEMAARLQTRGITVHAADR